MRKDSGPRRGSRFCTVLFASAAGTHERAALPRPSGAERSYRFPHSLPGRGYTLVGN
jgi:hypothetical protein